MATSDYTLKQNDTYPPIVATLSDESGPIDLTDAAGVQILLKLVTEAGTTLVVGDCDLEMPLTNGVVSYDWDPTGGDTAVVGVYKGEFQLTRNDPDSRIETFPNGSYFSLEIVADLGP